MKNKKYSILGVSVVLCLIFYFVGKYIHQGKIDLENDLSITVHQSYSFFFTFTIIYISNLAILDKFLGNKVGLLFLASFPIKVIVYMLLFNQIGVSVGDYSQTQRMIIVIPLLLFLTVETYVSVASLQNK